MNMHDENIILNPFFLASIFIIVYIIYYTIENKYSGNFIVQIIKHPQDKENIDNLISLASYKKDARLLWKSCALALHNDYFSLALKALHFIDEINENSLATKYYRGMINIKLNRIEQARRDLQNVLDNNIKYINAHIIYGLALWYAQRNLDALIEFKRALNHNPENDIARYRLGVLYESEGKFDKAIAEYKEITKHAKNKSKGHLGMADIYFHQGKQIEAEQQYKLAILSDIKCHQAYLGLGSLYISQQRWEEAVEVIKRGIDSDKSMEKYFKKFSKNLSFINQEIKKRNIGLDQSEDES